MILLIDSNIVLDVLLNRHPFAKDSSMVWKLCETGRIKGYISALTFANIVYVMRKQLDSSKIRDILSMLAMIFEFAELGYMDLHEAASLSWDDYEDAVQSVTAKRLKADCIITRNVKDFIDSEVKALSPEEFILQLA